MLNTAWEYFIIVLESALFFLLANSKLTTKEHLTKSAYLYQVVFLFAISVIELFANHNHAPTMLLVIGIFLSHVLYCALFFEDSLFIKVIWSLLYSALAIMADSISSMIPIYVLQYPKEQVLSFSGIVRVIFTLLYILILSALIFAFIAMGIQTIRLSWLQKLIVLIISITCIVIEQMTLISIIDEKTKHGMSTNISIYIFFLVFFLYFCLMFYIYNLGMEREKNEKLLADGFISKMNQIQYEQMLSTTESLRGIKHDISNHLDTLSLLINSKEYDKAADYISSLSLELSKNHRFISTGNIPVDCIISNKYALATSNHISFDYTIHLPKKLPLDDISVCSLLGNILDNAIESCEKLSPKDRRISLTIRPFNNMLLISLTNSSAGDYRISKSGRFLTTKKDESDGAYHGIGMKQICRIVKEKSGFIRFSPESDSFTLEIMIPLENQ